MISFVDGATDDGVYLPVTVFVSVTSSGLCSFISSSPANILAGLTFFSVIFVVVIPSSSRGSLRLAARVAIYVLFQVPSSDRVLDGAL